MSPGSSDSSPTTFCGSTSLALSAIREANNGYGEGLELNTVTCYPEGHFEGWDYFPWQAQPNPIDVSVIPSIGGVPGTPDVYFVPAGEWIRIGAEGGEAGHVKVGAVGSEDGVDCGPPPNCEPEEVPGTDWGNNNHPFQWHFHTVSGEDVVDSYSSASDEEEADLYNPPVAPGSCECPDYRCHDERYLWLQMPLPDDNNPNFESVIDVYVWREPTIAYDQAPIEHIQLDVADNRSPIGRDFHVTPSADAAGFTLTQASNMVSGVNELLGLTRDAPPQHGPRRLYDINWDGTLDSNARRGYFDAHVAKKFEIDDYSVLPGSPPLDQWPSPDPFLYPSGWTGMEVTIITPGSPTHTIKQDDLVRVMPGVDTPHPEEDKWWSHKDATWDNVGPQSVSIVRRILKITEIVHDQSTGEILSMKALENSVLGSADLTPFGYNSNVVLQM
ncbi:MAG: hypothetical protein ACLFU6_09760, partial [Candidatus Hydrogenedentota bacterium]